MDKHNNKIIDKLQEEIEKKYKKREKKGRSKMRVSGAGVKKLQKLIRKDF